MGLDPGIIAGRINSIETILAENEGDPRVVYLAIIDDFLNTIGAGEFFPASLLSQQMLWTLYAETTIVGSRNLKDSLGVG